MHEPSGVSVQLRCEYATLSDFLVDQMVRRGIRSHRELGEFIGVAQATATRLLRGGRVPHEETLGKIAAAFGEDITEIRELAQRPAGESEPFVLAREFDQLTYSQRAAVERVCWEFIAAQGRRVTRS